MTGYRDPDQPEAAVRHAVELDRAREPAPARVKDPMDRILRLQRMAGNAAVSSLLARPGAGSVPVVQRGSPPSRNPMSGPPSTSTGPGGLVPGRGPEMGELPEKFDPSKTPGGTAFSVAKALADAARTALDKVALEAERADALSALMAKEPPIYDTLHANPGKGLMVNVNFKSTDPETVSQNRPPEFKPAMQVKFLSVTVSDPFEFPEPSEGPAVTPAAAGSGTVGFGWKGTTLSASVRPVRPDPNKVKKSEVIESAEALVAYMTTSFLPLPLVAGQLQRGHKSVVTSPAGVVQSVVEVDAFGTRLLVLESVATQVAQAMMSLAREEMRLKLDESATRIIRLQTRLEAFTTEGEVSRWWDRSFQIDPHLLDSPRAHLAAARSYFVSDDLSNAWESLSACEDTIDLVRNQLYAYETNDFSDPYRLSPTGVQGVV